MIQHAGLDLERWSRFTLAQQVLSIGAEMLRAGSSIQGGYTSSVRLSYERVLYLVDLTVEANRNPSLWRELLRWRELVAELYIAPELHAQRHDELNRVLMLFTPESARQLNQR